MPNNRNPKLVAIEEELESIQHHLTDMASGGNVIRVPLCGTEIPVTPMYILTKIIDAAKMLGYNDGEIHAGHLSRMSGFDVCELILGKVRVLKHHPLFKQKPPQCECPAR